jgi:death-on-curing protein
VTEEELVFLTVDDVLDLHADQIAVYGGDPGLRDRGLIESAVATPAATFGGESLHKDIFAMAAAYAFHIAESQGFVDGNKRTGLAAAYAFLGLNGYRLQEVGDRLYDAMIVVSAHRLDKEGLAQVFRELATPEE